MNSNLAVVVVNGYPKSGKNLFVEYCIKELESRGHLGYEVSTVDFVKELATQSGWSGKKTFKDRKFLSDMKDLLTEWGNVPYKKVEEIYVDLQSKKDFTVLFVHCREPKEIKVIVDKMDAHTLIVDRPDVRTERHSNRADEEVWDYIYEYIILNDGTVGDLKIKAEVFIEDLVPKS